MQRRDESRQSRSPRTTTAFYGIQFVTRSIDQFPQADLGTNLVCCPNQLLISWQNSVVCIIATIWLPEHPLETLLVEVEDGQMERCACRPCLVRFVMFSMCSAVSERPVPNRKPLPKRPSSSQSRSSLRPDVVFGDGQGTSCSASAFPISRDPDSIHRLLRRELGLVASGLIFRSTVSTWRDLRRIWLVAETFLSLPRRS